MICKGECLRYNPGDEPLTLMKCYNWGLLQLYETLISGGLSVPEPATQKKFLGMMCADLVVVGCDE